MKRQGATVPESGDTSSEGSTYGMPADYVIDPLQKAVFTRGWGRLSDEDLVDYQGRAGEGERQESEGRRPGFHGAIESARGRDQ